MKTLSQIVNEMKQLKLHTTVLIIMIIVSIASYVFYTDINDIKSGKEVTNNSISNLEFSIIESTLDDEIYKGSIQADLLSELITKDILVNYSDKTSLKWDLDHINPSYKVYDIINNIIAKRYINDDNVYNRVFAVSQNNIISTSFSFNKFERGESIYKFFNKDDNDSALNKIVKEKQKYAIINISGDSPQSVSDLKSVYASGGINELKNYFILVPSYITKDGDILGVPDTNAVGESQTNNKVIIIQVISCYDALITQSNIVDAFNTTYSTAQMANDYDLRLAYLRNYVLLGFILILSLLALHRYHRKVEE